MLRFNSKKDNKEKKNKLPFYNTSENKIWYLSTPVHEHENSKLSSLTADAGKAFEDIYIESIGDVMFTNHGGFYYQ